MSAATATGPAPLPGDLDRALADHAFRRRFAAAYDGPGEPDDALFWLAHPDRAAPSGAAPEAPRIAELRRAVYATPAGAALAPELRRLQELVTARREAAEAAYRSAAASERAAAPDEPQPVSESRPVPALDPAARAGRRRRRLLVAAGAAAALLGAAAGALPALQAPPPAQPRLTVHATVETRGPAELDRDWRPADRTTVTLGPAFVTGTIRRLAGYLDGETLIYGARDRFGHVCLLAAAIYYQSACVPEDRFRASGIALTWTLDSTPPWRAPETGVAVWRPDGRLLLGPAKR